MTYSMFGFGADGSCEGSSTAGAEVQRTRNEKETACEKAVRLRQTVNRLQPIVDSQKSGWGEDETTQEEVELFTAKRELPAASAACDSAISKATAALNKFIKFQASGCYSAGAPTTQVVLPEVVIEGPPKPKPVAPQRGFSPAACPPEPSPTKFGQRGQAVYCWQRYLISQGFSLAPYGADGDHGATTERLTKEWQEKKRASVAPAPVTPAPVAPAPVAPAPVVVQAKPQTASMLPDDIFGVPTRYAIAGAAALFIGGAVLYMRSQPESRE